MCYANAILSDGASTGRSVRSSLIAVAAALFLLTSAAGCMTIKDCTITVRNESGKQTVSIGDKDVRVPIDATVPASTLGAQ